MRMIRIFECMRWWHAVVLISLVAAAIVPLSSELPDGLEWVTERLSLKGLEGRLFKAPFQDYTLPFAHELIGGIFSALIGVLFVSAVTYIIAKLLIRRRQKNSS